MQILLSITLLVLITTSVFLFLRLQNKLKALRKQTLAPPEASTQEAITTPINQSKPNIAPDRPITEEEFQRLLGHFQEPQNSCCKKFEFKKFSNPPEYNQFLLDLSASQNFENMSIDDDMAWIVHYKCKNCKEVWELSTPTRGYAGYFKNVDLNK